MTIPILVVLSLVAPAAAKKPPDVDLKLGVGDELFWDGEYVREAHVKNEAYFFAAGEPGPLRDATDMCGKPFACFEYTLTVTEPGTRLRIAIDSSARSDNYGFQVLDPDGVQADFPINYPNLAAILGNSFNLESVIDDPKPGKWTVKVVPFQVRDWAFRMRAILEGPAAAEPDLLVPNLIPWLPSEFGFVAPVNPQAGSAQDALNPAGLPGTSCHRDEAEDGATHCLRFSTGVHNVGEGPLDIEFDESDQAFQHVYYSDDTPGYYGDNEEQGNYIEREAGTGEFHESHGHRHYQDMVLYELFAVSDASAAPPYDEPRRLSPFGEGDKHGYCTGDQAIGDWRSFNQDRPNAVHTHEPGPPDCEKRITLSKGWGDVYRWQRPGQYVPYDRASDANGTMRAGHYVVRVTVDPNERLMETNERDNVGYALIRVVDGAGTSSDVVVICERGFGKSPWDPRKRVAEESWWWTVLGASQAPTTNGNPNC